MAFPETFSRIEAADFVIYQCSLAFPEEIKKVSNEIILIQQTGVAEQRANKGESSGRCAKQTLIRKYFFEFTDLFPKPLTS